MFVGVAAKKSRSHSNVTRSRCLNRTILLLLLLLLLDARAEEDEAEDNKNCKEVSSGHSVASFPAVMLFSAAGVEKNSNSSSCSFKARNRIPCETTTRGDDDATADEFDGATAAPAADVDEAAAVEVEKNFTLCQNGVMPAQNFCCVSNQGTINENIPLFVCNQNCSAKRKTASDTVVHPPLVKSTTVAR